MLMHNRLDIAINNKESLVVSSKQKGAEQDPCQRLWYRPYIWHAYTTLMPSVIFGTVVGVGLRLISIITLVRSLCMSTVGLILVQPTSLVLVPSGSVSRSYFCSRKIMKFP